MTLKIGVLIIWFIMGLINLIIGNINRMNYGLMWVMLMVTLAEYICYMKGW